MKKTQILFLSVILVVSLSACEKQEALRSLDRVKLANGNAEESKIENPEVVKAEEEKSPNHTLDKN